MDGACDTYGIELHVGFGTTPLGGPRSRTEDNIQIDFQKVGLEGVNRTHLSYHKCK